MSEWTPEAREYLDGYLAQVRALARQRGEDADEIATELCEHIQREAEASSGSVVSLEHLRKVLATVGTPEQTASADSLLMRTAAESPTRGEGPSLQPGQQPTPQGVVQTLPAPVRKKSRAGCWVALVGMFLLALLGVALCALLVNFQWRQMKKARIYADEKATAAALQAIYAGENRYLEESGEDNDGDGVPDYATIGELFKRGLIPQHYSQETYANHVYNLTLTPSAKSGAPSFVCEAVPVFREYARTFAIDQTGEIKIASASGETLPVSAEQFQQERAETAVTINLRSVLRAEQTFVEMVKKDKDGDGVPDYATLEELKFSPSALDSERYIVNLTTRDSATNSGVPGFSCVATPRPSYTSAPTYSIDQTGKIRVESDPGALVTHNSKAESAAPNQP